MSSGGATNCLRSKSIPCTSYHCHRPYETMNTIMQLGKRPIGSTEFHPKILPKPKRGARHGLKRDKLWNGPCYPHYAPCEDGNAGIYWQVSDGGKKQLVACRLLPCRWMWDLLEVILVLNLLCKHDVHQVLLLACLIS